MVNTYKSSRKKTIIIGISITILLLGAALVIYFFARDAVIKEDNRRVTEVAINKTREQCLKAKITDQVCGNLQVSIDQTECAGDICWAVVVTPVDKSSKFFASMFVESREDGSYVPTYYTDSIIQNIQP